jgi:hypothetical protein
VRTVVIALVCALSGCSSMGGSAIRTGPLQMPAYNGPVSIYSSGQPPPGASDLGVVEVHAAQTEGTIDELLPQFVRKVAQIGGNIAVIDGIRARFEIVGRTHVETYYYTCNLGATCAGTRVYSANDEVMIVSVFGHAYTTLGPAAPAEAPNAPLVPPGPPATFEPQPSDAPQPDPTEKM